MSSSRKAMNEFRSARLHSASVPAYGTVPSPGIALCFFNIAVFLLFVFLPVFTVYNEKCCLIV